MPTGYTDKIVNDQSFEDFLLGCARAFGACVHQYDEAMNEKPRLQTFDTIYEDELLQIEAEVGALRTMTRQQREEYGQELKEEQLRTHF